MSASSDTLKEQVTTLCSMLEGGKREEIKELLCRIHNCGGGIDYTNDTDFAAQRLEETGDRVISQDLKREIYEHAYFRAKWCAAAATGGGEGLARTEIVNRIKTKINRLSGPTGAE